MNSILAQLIDEKLRGVLGLEGCVGLEDLVVVEHARGAPHDDLLGLETLQVVDRLLAHVVRDGVVTVARMHNAAAVGRAADGDVVDAEEIEDVGHGANHVGISQHVTAEVEHHSVRIGIDRFAALQTLRLVLSGRRR